MRKLITSSTLAVALLSIPSIAVAQSGGYCLKSQNGMTKCTYRTMAQCEQVKRTGDQCLSRAETTGAAPSTTRPLGNSRPPSPTPSR
jgi:hypothetical protein